MTAPLDAIAAFLDGYLEVPATADYPNALNGLQVEGRARVRRFAVAVDASEAVVESVRDWADLLIVHHGLFWGGLQPLAGPHYRKVKALVESGTALYSAHLPLDCHPEAGNAAILARRLGLTGLEPFGDYRGTPLGWTGSAAAPDGPRPLPDFARDLSGILGGEVKVLPGGPARVAKAAVVTGAGASTLPEAAARGADALVTGEARHHHAAEAAELGVTLLLGGHYATETWGVRRLRDLVAQRFGVEGRFVDSPSGL